MKKNLIGFTGNRTGYNDPGDNNWSHNINYAIKTIAGNLDKFEYGIDDVARETEAAAGRRFQELQDVLAEFVNSYTEKIESEEDIAYANLKQYVEDRLNNIASSFADASQYDLDTTIAIKNMIENQIAFIDKNIKYLKEDFDYNLNLFNTKIATAKSQRDGVIEVLSTSIINAEAILKDHIANKSNPHRTRLTRLASAATVYQVDKNNSTSLIEPGFVAPSKKITTGISSPSFVINSDLDFVGKTLGFGEYANNLNSVDSLGAHFYITFLTSATLVDSSGATGTYGILDNEFIVITWDASSNKDGYIWKIGYQTEINRFDPLTIEKQSTITRVFEGQKTLFVLYFADAPYPNIFALLLGMVDASVYVGNNANSIYDVTHNWTSDITGTPAAWAATNNPETPLPHYWITALEEEPTTKNSVEGHYITPPTWIPSAHQIESAAFRGAPFITYLSSFDWWGVDANDIYIKVKYDMALPIVTFVYNMFERVPNIPIPITDLDYFAIATDSRVAEVTWTFSDTDKIEEGDTITVTTKRYNIQTGADLSLNTTGQFIVTAAIRFNG